MKVVSDVDGGFQTQCVERERADLGDSHAGTSMGRHDPVVSVRLDYPAILVEEVRDVVRIQSFQGCHAAIVARDDLGDALLWNVLGTTGNAVPLSAHSHSLGVDWRSLEG